MTTGCTGQALLVSAPEGGKPTVGMTWTIPGHLLRALLVCVLLALLAGDVSAQPVHLSTQQRQYIRDLASRARPDEPVQGDLLEALLNVPYWQNEPPVDNSISSDKRSNPKRGHALSVDAALGHAKSALDDRQNRRQNFKKLIGSWSKLHSLGK